MKIYYKIVDGKTTIKPLNQIVLLDSGYQIINPTIKLVEQHGWLEYSNDVEEEKETELEIVKKKLIEEAYNYYKSENVKSFILNDTKLWLDDTERNKLRFRFESELKNSENTETVLWVNGKNFNLNINDAIDMLYQLEYYASKCYDTLQYHLLEIKNTEDIEFLYSYNYTFRYPEIMSF